MATKDEVKDAMRILIGARLGNAPSASDIPSVLDSWILFAKDIPGETLKQAAIDHAMTSEYWPRPVEIRKRAEQVKIHNGTSAAGSHFQDDTRLLRSGEIQGVWRVTKESWNVFTPDPRFRPDTTVYPEIEPPPHPQFKSWAEAQSWQESQRESVGA